MIFIFWEVTLRDTETHLFGSETEKRESLQTTGQNHCKLFEHERTHLQWLTIEKKSLTFQKQTSKVMQVTKKILFIIKFSCKTTKED